MGSSPFIRTTKNRTVFPCREHGSVFVSAFRGRLFVLRGKRFAALWMGPLFYKRLTLDLCAKKRFPVLWDARL